MTRLRGYNITASTRLVTEECCNCGVPFAIPDEMQDRLRENHNWFYCPNGHPQRYTGEPRAREKLRRAEAKAVQLQDQLRASEADRERTRAQLVRYRHRVANGVCPCCNRVFPALARHMKSKHPDFDAGDLSVKRPEYRCSCGRKFDTPHGLAVHQGRRRSDRWNDPAAPEWSRHLTVVSR